MSSTRPRRPALTSRVSSAARRGPTALAGDRGDLPVVAGPARSVTRTERATLARLERRIEARLEAGEGAAWDVGMLFDGIARGALHHAAGYETLEAYADARFPRYGYRTLRRYRRVALAFTRGAVRKHGLLKLELGLRYIELTPASERAAEIPRLVVRVPANGLIPFARASARQLEDAIDALSPEDVRPPSLPRGAGAKVRALQAVLKSGPAWTIQRPRLTTRVVKAADGRSHALVSIVDVPVEQLGRLLSSLRRLA